MNEANVALTGAPQPADPPRREPHPMPFTTTYQHEYWSVDVR